MSNAIVPRDQAPVESHPLDPHRELPQDIPAEQSVLGAMLLSPNAITAVAEILQSVDFVRPAHQAIYECVTELYRDNHPVDAITTADELQRRGELIKVGGAPYLHTLTSTVPTAANVSFYADIVFEKAFRRSAIECSIAQAQYAYITETDLEEVATRIQRRFDEFNDRRTRARQKTPLTLGDRQEDLLAALDRIAAGEKGLSTGFVDVDAVTNGLFPGQMVTVAARPGVGKSALMTDMVRAAAVKQRKAVIIFSLEMSAEEVHMRIASAEASIRISDMRGGRMTDDDWTRLARTLGGLQEVPVIIDDTPGLSAADIEIRTGQYERELLQAGYELGLFAVDYMQLMVSNKRSENRQTEVSEFSRRLKALAKKKEVPMVALSQLNRGPEQRQDKKPMPSDLRESGSIEQDSDIVILIHRPDAFERDDPRMGEADLILAKNRFGPTTTVTVAHQLHYSRFVDMAQQ